MELMIMTIIIGFRLGRGCNCAIHLVVEGFFLHSGAFLVLIRQLKIVALLVDPAEDPVVQLKSTTIIKKTSANVIVYSN